MARRSREASRSVSYRVLIIIREGHRRRVVGLRARPGVPVRVPLIVRPRARVTVVARANAARRPQESALAMVAWSGRLISHRWCRTSKPTYVHVSLVLRLQTYDRVTGLYVAWEEDVSRRGRSVAMQLAPLVDALARVAKWLEKHEDTAMTRILRVAARFAAAYVFGWLFSAGMLGVLAATIALLAVRAIGLRELYYTRHARHCSAYAIVKGLPYEGMPSMWWYWHRRYNACRSVCTPYRNTADKTCYAVCFRACEEVLSQAEPRTVYWMWPRAVQHATEVMERMGCAAG